MNPITCEELANMLVTAINAALVNPIADNDDGGADFTVATPATGQLFTITVSEKA